MPPPKNPPPALLAWLHNRDALVRRVVLSEVLAPPRSRRPVARPGDPRSAPSSGPADATKTPVRKADP